MSENEPFLVGRWRGSTRRRGEWKLIPDSNWPAAYQVSGGEGRGRGNIINPWLMKIVANSREMISTIVRLLMKAQDREEDGAGVAGP